MRRARLPALLLCIFSLTACQPIPTLEQWRMIPDAERRRLLDSWSYNGRARPLIVAINKDFMAHYGHLPGIRGAHPGILQGGLWRIDVDRAFIVDKRKIPSRYLGLYVNMPIATKDLPPEFRRRAPRTCAAPRYEAFVDHSAAEIRRQLGPLTRDEMLHALIGMSLEDLKKHCREQVKKGLMEPFE